RLTFFVVADAASASGVTAIDDVDLDVVIAHIHGRFRSCLARARKVDPQAGGLNKIAIELGADGHVLHTEVVCSDSVPQLAECLRASFVDVLFTPPKTAPVRHVVPIVLQSH
ncbi:MAG: hypothetical protein ACHREM_29455, partial [Polyangiales bacterium]